MVIVLKENKKMYMSQENMSRNRIPFSQRLFWSIFFIFLGFTVCFLIFQYQRETEFTREKLNSVLSSYNYQLYHRAQHTDDLSGMVKEFIEEIPEQEMRVTIIAPSGDVLFDNSLPGKLDNHNNRSEVRKARRNMNGFAIRASGSTGQEYFYSANNIDGYIYRCAIPYGPYIKSSLKINKEFIYFMALMVLVFFIVLSRFTFSIGQTIAKLKYFSQNVPKNPEKEIEYTFPNDELGDIAQHIITIYRKQQKAKNELALEREKLIKHFQYAKEGFAMFTEQGVEILSNIQLIQFANVISDEPVHAAEEVIDIPELESIRNFLKEKTPESRVKALRQTATINKAGKTFLVECLLFLNNSYELSISDITRQEEEYQMKRQLTQNIAHELKTPVSSIQGYLETLLYNSDIEASKQKFFLERCYSQSLRLSGLLQDISVLNRLDEASGMFELTDVSLNKLLEEIEKECAQQLEVRDMKTKVLLPEEAMIHGNYSLLYSIFRNLYDNAIAYAGDGVSLVVDCYKEDNLYYYFSFSDNGAGIPEEHLNRIFERFYRVDKGRSRKAGGTGLGLSIVKNAVLFHRGQISAKSTLGQGVTFLFTLKKKV